MSGPDRRPSAEVATSADWPEVTALRTRVFVEEQGVPPEIERDDADATAVHAVSRDASGRVVATGRLIERDGAAVIGRMATDPAARGRGHATAVLTELHRQARLRGFAEVELHAQLTARGLYDRAGYTAAGEEYEEAGLRHVTMRRLLQPADPPTDTFCQTLGVDPSQCEDRDPAPGPRDGPGLPIPAPPVFPAGRPPERRRPGTHDH